MGRISHARGAAAEAKRHFDEALEVFTAVGARFEAARTTRELAALTTGMPGQCLQPLKTG
jgi:hypothetical protein